MDTRTAARWAFILGIVLAIVVALVPDISDWAVWVMLVLGLFAGYVFIDGNEEMHFLIIAVGLTFFKESLVDFPSIGDFVTALLTSLSVFFGVMVVSLVVRNIIDWVRAG